MSLAQFWLMFALGLVSGIHCVQMCGPIVLSYSLPLAGGVAPRAKLAWAHFWYNLGRVTTYTALGGLAGAAGGAIGLTARLAGIAHGGRIAAGVAMIAAGIYLTGFVRRADLIRIDSPGIAARLARAGKRFMLSIRPTSKFRLGLVLGFLPCGLVYAALLKAVDAGSALGGAAAMLAFGSGTSLALGATGLASTSFGWRLGRWSNALAGAGMVFAGALLIWMGLGPAGHVHHHANF
ncbi:MAG: sulfite exporter TauE/SafE family protein [Bryobacteraceae bacterium]|jgi:sulfite exporter TauE/SafE